MSRLSRALAAVDENLLALVVSSVVLGLSVPGLARLRPLALPILAVMVGSVSLTLSPSTFRGVDRRALGVVLAVQAGVPLLAFGAARALALNPDLTLGFVVLGAVTPELVTPTMTAVADGDTALSTVVLVALGLASLGWVPGFVALLVADVPVPAGRVVENLVLAVVAPMVVAVAARARYPERVGRHDDRYPAVSALMVVLILAIVTADNAPVVRANLGLVPAVAVAALAVNLGGYAAGWAASVPFDRRTRIAASLSTGMRDFAVAAALVVAAGLPAAASLPAVVFGVVEMTTSAALAQWVGE